MKTYVLTLSKAFPATHPRKGEPTGFVNKLISATKQINGVWWKKHTIRANYPLWAKRIAEVQLGEAELSVRIWLGAPYRSKQAEVARLTKDDGVGIQKLVFWTGRIGYPTVGDYNPSMKEIAHNDGLTTDDWVYWFNHYDLSKPLAIIHFTPFRYL